MEKIDAISREQEKKTDSTGSYEDFRRAVLDKNPKELTEYLGYLESSGKLESFLTTGVEDEQVLAQLSYWEKWLSKDQQKKLDEIIAMKKNIYDNSEISSASLPLDLDKRFNAEQIKNIFSNLAAIQLTFGCSKACPFCAADALPGAREHIPYTQISNMFAQYGEDLGRSRPVLYWASEPSDYTSKEGDEDKTYFDVHELAIRYANYSPGITSKNYTKEWLEGMNSISKTPGEIRFSILTDNVDRRNQIIQSLKSLTVKHEKLIMPRHEEYLGKSSTRYELDSELIAGAACEDGVLLTPRGLYNMVVVPVSKEYPQGSMVVPIEQIEGPVDISVGQKLRDILPYVIVGVLYSHAGRKTGDSKQIYVGSFPKPVRIIENNQDWFVYINESGEVVEKKNLKEYRKEVMSMIEEALNRGVKRQSDDELVVSLELIRHHATPIDDEEFSQRVIKKYKSQLLQLIDENLILRTPINLNTRTSGWKDNVLVELHDLSSRKPDDWNLALSPDFFVCSIRILDDGRGSIHLYVRDDEFEKEFENKQDERERKG